MLSEYIKIKIHRTVILPAVLYECETWSLTLREEHNLKVFENRVLRAIFLVGVKEGGSEGVTGDYKKLRNGEIYKLCFTGDIVWVIQ